MGRGDEVGCAMRNNMSSNDDGNCRCLAAMEQV
jgi:hypothetical protein